MPSNEETSNRLVTVFLKTKTGTYIFERPNSPHREDIYLVDDATVVFKPYGRSEIFELPKIPSQVFLVTTVRNISHYIDIDNPSIHKSITDFELERMKMESKFTKYKDEDEGNLFVYPSLECEYEYRIFLKRWQPEYVLKIVNNPCKVVISEVLYSEYEDIQPHNILAGNSYSDVSCTYTSNFSKWFSEICAEHGIIHIDENDKIPSNSNIYWTNTTHSLLRFVKINHDYIFSDREYEKNVSFRGPYSECVVKRNVDYNTLKEKLLLKIKLIKDKKIAETERSNIYSHLQNVLKSVSSLDVKNVSRGDHLRTMNKLKDIMQLLIENKNGT